MLRTTIHLHAASAFLAATLLASSAAAAPGRVIAFGDSITEGKGFDDPSRPEPGYPLRLEEALQDSQLQIDVQNLGKGGEDTTQGVTRIDGVLAAGDLMLVLMEGTNDISREISPETTLFNLDAMARKAEALGIIPLHATLIPRWPQAKVDAKNVLNSALADGIRELAAANARPIADPYARFSGINRVFERYYANLAKDPVGHPNADGFALLAEIFAPVVVEALSPIEVAIAPSTEAIVAGQPATFTATATVGTIASTEWQFSDGGRAWSARGKPLSATYVFTEPGTHEVLLVARDRFGRPSEATATVDVSAGEVATVDAESYVQVLANGSFGDGLVTGCEWRNRGTALAIVELSFMMRGNGVVPEVRRLALPGGAVVSVDDVLADLFAQPDTLGSLHQRTRGLGAAADVWTSCHALSRPLSATSGIFGEAVPEDPAARFSTEPRVIFGLHDDGKRFTTLRVANLDEEPGDVTIEVLDATGNSVGTRPAVLDLTGLAMRQRRLVDIEPAVRGAKGPFTVRLNSDGIRFLASGSVTLAASLDTTYVPAAAAPPAGELYLLRVARGANTFADAQTSELQLHNTGDATATVMLEYLPQGKRKARRANRQSRQLSVGPGQTVAFSDFLQQLFGQRSANGALRIVPVDGAATPLAIREVTTRVENKVSYLLPVAPVAASSALRIDESAVVTGVGNTATLRPLFGAVNLAGRNTGVLLRVLDPRGVEVAKGTVTLRAGQHVERALSQVISKLPKGTDLTIQLHVLQGGPVLPYLLSASTSGDAFFVPFRPVP